MLQVKLKNVSLERQHKLLLKKYNKNLIIR